MPQLTQSTSRILHLLIYKFRHLPPPTHIFALTLSVYFLLWIIDPGNKVIALTLFALVPAYSLKLKDFRQSLVLAFLASSIIATGKRYVIELIPPGVFPPEIFPYGHVTFITITAQTILSFFLCLLLFRDWFHPPAQRPVFQLLDLLLLATYLINLLTDQLGSIYPQLTLIFTLFSLQSLILYFSLKRYFSKPLHRTLPLFLALITAQVVFESVISLQQLVASSPIYKHLESQVDIAYFGHVADELQFRFRPLGTFSHANELGMWLGFHLLLLSSTYIFKPNRLALATIILGITTLTSTLSRSAWLGFLVGGLFLLYILTKHKPYPLPRLPQKYLAGILLASGLLLFLFVFPRAEKSIYTLIEGGGRLRSLQIEETISLFLSRPWFGTGANMSVLAGYRHNPTGVFSQVALSVHNWYLLYLVEHGLIISLLFGLFLLLSTTKALKKTLHTNYLHLTHFVNLGLTSGILVLLTIGFFQPFIGESLLLVAFGILSSSSKSRNHHPCSIN